MPKNKVKASAQLLVGARCFARGAYEASYNLINRTHKGLKYGR